MLSKCTCRS